MYIKTEINKLSYIVQKILLNHFTGGIMTDYVTPYEDPAEVVDPHYSGCMSNLIVNGQHYPLKLERGWTGWSIGDCDGTACGAEV